MGTEFGRGAVTPKVKTGKRALVLNSPSKYQVYLLNDDYTPMDFVVVVLQQFFRMSYPLAIKIMLEVHHQGKGICGIFTRDIAETKVAQVNEFARLSDHPLLCKMEKIG